jgi:two-component system, NtrC family, sensor histidine kinase HydH
MESGKRSILIVDDDPSFARMVSMLLAGQEKFEVSTAFSGRKAIEKISQEAPDLVILDLNLPDIPGENILDKIKEIDEDIGTIVVTGYGGEQIAVDLMKAGALDFIPKPFERAVLLAAIENALKIRDARSEDRHRKKYATLEYFFPFLAHEVRNPLHAILGALTIIERRSNLKDELQAKAIKIIHEEVTHLTEFVQECLGYVRPPQKSLFAEIGVNDLISRVLTTVSHMFAESPKAIAVTTEMGSDLPKFEGDYEEVKQCLVNIVRNAYEAMNGEGKLIIKTCFRPNPGHIEIVVSDSGAGIKKEHMKNLFSPFFTTKPKGTGLGLAVCHRIVIERHRGELDLQSEAGRGTTVTIRLPAMKGK